MARVSSEMVILRSSYAHDDAGVKLKGLSAPSPAAFYPLALAGRRVPGAAEPERAAFHPGFPGASSSGHQPSRNARRRMSPLGARGRRGITCTRLGTL